MMRCSECGRPAKAFVKHGRYRSRRARAGQPTSLKGHDLCGKCWERNVNQRYSRILASIGMVGSFPAHGTEEEQLAEGDCP